MNKTSDLIERIKAEQKLFLSGNPRYMVIRDLFDEAIAALSPALPEDVQIMLRKLDETSNCGIDLAAEARDLIERLARDLISANGIIEGYRERIEELKRYTCGFTDCRYQKLGKIMEAQIAEYIKALIRLGSQVMIECTPIEASMEEILKIEFKGRAKFALAELKRIRGMK